MRKLAFALITFFMLVVLIPSVFAAGASLSVDKKTVQPNETFTISGTITKDDGTTGVFTYRAAAVGPNRTFVCDSGKKETGADGKFSLTCTAPTREQSAALGVPAANTRSVIPLVAGVAFNDTATKLIMREHKSVLVILKANLTNRLNAIAKDIDSFVKIANNLSDRCVKALAIPRLLANANLTEKCTQIKTVTQAKIANMTQLKTKVLAVVQSATLENLQNLRENIKDSRENLKVYRSEFVKVKQVVEKVRANLPEMVRAVRGANK